MSFVRMRGCKMLVFVPEEQSASGKKHNCRDCFSCQWCSDERCKVCLNRKNTSCRRHSSKSCRKARKHPRTEKY